MTRDANRNDRASLEARFRARVDDLDRVWYAAFMKNSPAATTLDVPLPGAMAPTVEKKPEAGKSPASNAAPRIAVEAPPRAAAAQSVVRPAETAAPAALDWCEVLDREPDPEVVTDPSLRDAIAATGLPWRVRDRTSGIEMLLVPPGTFRMGRSDGDRNARSNEAPAHQVAIARPYYLGRFEVTQGEWTKVMGSDPRSRQRSAPESDGGLVIGEGGGAIIVRGRVGLVDQSGNALEAVNVTQQNEDGTVTFTTIGVDPEQEREVADPRPDLPAFASWSAASEFCRRADLRLPTEAEWERACRAGGDAPRYGVLDAIAWHRGNAVGRRHPVGTKAANALGFHDMIGNAWEWVNDWYAEYTRTPKSDPAGPESGRSRIIRGGYFDENDPYYCRSSLRYEMQSPDFAASTGFRVARNP